MAPVTVTTGQANDDQFVPDELVGLLHRASETMALSLISDLSPRERADLAMFCYRKAHLHRIGLIIAATCEQDTLVQALGTNLGKISMTKPANGRSTRRSPRSAPAPRLRWRSLRRGRWPI